MRASNRQAPGEARAHNRRRLRFRIILSFFLLGTGLTALFAYATNYARGWVEGKLIADVMERNINIYANRYYRNPEKTPEIPTDQMYARVVHPDNPQEMAELAREFPTWVDLPQGVIKQITNIDPESGERITYRVAAMKRPDAWFFLAYDTKRASESDRRLMTWLYASIGVFSLLSLLLGWWSASQVMKPVLELASRIRRSSARASDTPDRLAWHFADDEVGEVARALDDYSDRLTDVVQRDREFNADVSHELRTPLAVIRSTVELLLSQDSLDDKTRQRLQRIQRAQETGTDLISALLQLSRHERAHGSTQVARVAEHLLEAHRLQMRGKQLELRVVGNRDLVVDAPEQVVSVALGNLIGNAVKYTAEGSVVVHLHDSAVDVIDSGPGLSAEDAAKLFERGYRGAHAEHTQGGGIGLSIVRRLCDLYGWEVRVTPGKARGVVATLVFGRDARTQAVAHV